MQEPLRRLSYKQWDLIELSLKAEAADRIRQLPFYYSNSIMFIDIKGKMR